MRDFRDAKAMAQTLREALKAKSVSVTHSESLELVARTFRFARLEFPGREDSGEPVGAVGAGHRPARCRQQPSFRSSRSGISSCFPKMVAPIFVGREKTKRAIERATATDGRILVVTQRRAADDDPALDALYPFGVIASVISLRHLADGAIKLFVSGIERAAVVRPVEEDFLLAETAPFEEIGGQTTEAAALFKAVLDAYQIWAKVDFSTLPEEPRARLLLPDHRRTPAYWPTRSRHCCRSASSSGRQFLKPAMS